MIVYLTLAEIQLAYNVAGQRCCQNMKLEVKQRYGSLPEENAQIEVFSCRGEMAVAKYLNLFWSGSIGDFKAVDVGGLVEVRTVDKKGRRLIVHPEDKDWPPFVFVDASDAPNINLVGWLYGYDAKQEKYWADPTGNNRPAYFVPQSDLRPMEDLNELIRSNSISPAQ